MYKVFDKKNIKVDWVDLNRKIILQKSQYLSQLLIN